MPGLWESIFGSPEESSKREDFANPDRYFDVDELWTRVKGMRTDPSFRGAAHLQTIGRQTNDPVDAAAQVVAFFKIPEAELRGLSVAEAWDRILLPLMKEIETRINARRPAGIPGRIRFDNSEKDELHLVYFDPEADPDLLK